MTTFTNGGYIVQAWPCRFIAGWLVVISLSGETVRVANVAATSDAGARLWAERWVGLHRRGLDVLPEFEVTQERG